MDITAFKGFSQPLDLLPKTMHSSILELIFSYRMGEFSAVVVFDKKKHIEKLVGFSLPEELLNYDSFRYAVDLESINTDIIRIYVDSRIDDGVAIYGYYFNKNATLIEKKLYKKHADTVLLIDRYDASDDLISAAEEEIECVESDWKGPKGIVDVAKTIIGNVPQYRYLFLKKVSKDQNYIRIRDNPIADNSYL
jgi:hypothetical protein